MWLEAIIGGSVASGSFIFEVRAGPPLLNAPLQSRNDPQETFLADLQDMFFVWHNDRLNAM